MPMHMEYKEAAKHAKLGSLRVSGPGGSKWGNATRLYHRNGEAWDNDMMLGLEA